MPVRLAPTARSSSDLRDSGHRENEDEPAPMEREQVLHRQVGACEQRHREPQPWERVGGLRQVVAEDGAEKRLTRRRVDQDHRNAGRHDQRKRAQQDRAGILAAARSPGGLGEQVHPQAHRHPHDRLGRHRGHCVRAGRVAVELVLHDDHVDLLQREEQRQSQHRRGRPGHEVAQRRSFRRWIGAARAGGRARGRSPRTKAPCRGTRLSRQGRQPRAAVRTRAVSPPRR